MLTARALTIDGDGFRFNVTDGSGGRKGVNLGYEIEVEDLALISKFAKGTELAGSLKAKGRVEGEITNPKISIDGDIDGFELNDNIKAETITIKAEGKPDLSDPDIKAEVNAETISVGEREFESVEIDADSEGGNAVNAVAVITENDDFEALSRPRGYGARKQGEHIAYDSAGIARFKFVQPLLPRYLGGRGRDDILRRKR